MPEEDHGREHWEGDDSHRQEDWDPADQFDEVTGTYGPNRTGRSVAYQNHTQSTHAQWANDKGLDGKQIKLNNKLINLKYVFIFF